MEHRFTPTVFLILGGLLIWAADFLVVYVFAALACAQGFADIDVLGLEIVPFVTTLVSVAASAASVMIVRGAVHRSRTVGYDTHSRFILFLTGALGALALVAIVWSALPPLIVKAGCN